MKTALTLATPNSTNKKLKGKRPIAATYRTPDTCAADCPFVVKDDAGQATEKRTCYAASGPGGGAFALANRSGVKTADAFHRIKSETPPNAVVRHLVSGDLDADYIEEANALHSERPDLEGYAYTHHWRNLSPSLFKGWTVNASCETTTDVEKAIANGWQAVIESPESDSLHGQRIAGRRVVTCPAQRSDAVKCSDCKLCHSDNPTRPVVEFILHGGHIRSNSATLVTIRNSERNQA